jgi:hypothetical protein
MARVLVIYTHNPAWRKGWQLVIAVAIIGRIRLQFFSLRKGRSVRAVSKSG